MTAFDGWFAQLAGNGAVPHDWQRALAVEDQARTRVIRVPTGMGKTLGVLASWAFHRVHRADDRWPRRLVWCLPMRVLVEQTEAVVHAALARVECLWSEGDNHAGKVGVHVLMGGVDAGTDWNLFPEESAVVIGTQDMLLSRALNRGYASPRARWPLEFGLLSHDALWVMDEVQLMDVGLATSAQLQAFHDDNASRGQRPRHTWWMSATLQPKWLASVDTAARHAAWIAEPTTVAREQREHGLGSIRKAVSVAAIPSKDPTSFARRVFEQHNKLSDETHGRITLVVCNTVQRACETYDALRALAPAQSLELVHSRFRPHEREQWRPRFLDRGACVAGADRIIVATQVVEAGVDVSAGCVVTDLAPWPSLVQRFGRCARYGGRGEAVVVDRGRDEKSAPPYEIAELDAAWDALSSIITRGADVGIASLEAFEEGLDASRRAALFPYAPAHLLLRRDLDELFDTTADLTGADLDISRFIRSGDERDVSVFWLNVAKAKNGEPPIKPNRRHRPRRNELCAVPFLRARDWLCGPETQTNRKPKLRASMRAWVWDFVAGEWLTADRSMLIPGRVVCVAAECGGYRVERGFDLESTVDVACVPILALTAEAEAQNQADEHEDGDDLSASEWKTIACHVGEVAELADTIGRGVGLPTRVREILVLAARWHDLGKAHAAFQGAIRRADRPNRQDIAKAPKDAWKTRPPQTYRTADDRDRRPGLRHELASALALFAVLRRHRPEHDALLGPWVEAFPLIGRTAGDLRDNARVHAAGDAGAPEEPTRLEAEVLACTADEFDLLVYLVASHHGKVRMSLNAAPRDQEYRNHDDDGRGPPIRGVREGDVLPPVALEIGGALLPELMLTLEPAYLGLSSQTGRSWRERTLELLGRFGPGSLAWLEAVLIAADRRASRLTTDDPVLTDADKGPR